MPLAELAAAVREGRTTSSALVAESLRRIEAGDGPVNAVVLRRDEDALADAAALDARVAAGNDPGPLAGLPLLVKDTEDCAGLPTTLGSLLRKDAAPAERDCDAVARLRAAGAVVVGKTNTPEFAFEGFTSNRLFGDTHNPWALDWSPGGSSGGSGAALAMGLAPLATGTDGGGSIRNPRGLLRAGRSEAHQGADRQRSHAVVDRSVDERSVDGLGRRRRPAAGGAPWADRWRSHRGSHVVAA